MPKKRQGIHMVRIVMIVMVFGWLWSPGCASEGPKPPARPVQQEIKSDSDRFFEKMKQEERVRDKGGERPIMP